MILTGRFTTTTLVLEERRRQADPVQFIWENQASAHGSRVSLRSYLGGRTCRGRTAVSVGLEVKRRTAAMDIADAPPQRWGLGQFCAIH